jgi:hypothetical protein
MPVSSPPTYQENIDRLLALIGGLAEHEIALALETLRASKGELSSTILENDEKLDMLDRELNALCLKYMAEEKLNEEDLRGVVCAVKISLFLERIGDYAKNIAARAVTIESHAGIQSVTTLFRMGMMAQKSLSLSLNAIATRDVNLARQAWHQDSDLDVLYNACFSRVLASNTHKLDDNFLRSSRFPYRPAPTTSKSSDNATPRLHPSKAILLPLCDTILLSLDAQCQCSPCISQVQWVSTFTGTVFSNFIAG